MTWNHQSSLDFIKEWNLVRLGNWLTAEEARRFWQSPAPNTLKGKRDRAILAVLLGCGLRRRELSDLDFTHSQQREEHWAIVDLVGEGGHIRTVLVPDWVKMMIDKWVAAAGISAGRLFRCVCRAGKHWGDGITERVVCAFISTNTATSGKCHRLEPRRRSCVSFSLAPAKNNALLF